MVDNIMAGDEQKLERLVEKYGLSDAELNAVVDRIKNPSDGQPNTVRHEWGGKRTRIGVVSDIHMGSLYVNQGALDDLMKRFKKHKVDAVYNPGDMTEGYNMRPGHTLEVELHGSDAQVQGVVDRVPDIGVPHYFITGNHDHAHWKNAGVDVGRWIDSQRPDMHYLGKDNAIIELSDDVTLQLMHPAGGSAYAVCFDGETEILTENGWKNFSMLVNGERVATLNNNNMFEWQEPYDYIEEEYYGKMIHFVSRNVDMMVTPNHRMWVRRYPVRANRKDKVLIMPQKARKQLDYSWDFVEARNLLGHSRQSWQMQRGGVDWVGKNKEYITIPPRLPKKYASTRIKHIGDVLIEDMAELIAWYVTDGHIDKKQKQLDICQSKRVNPDNHSQIIDLFSRLGFETKGRGRDSKDITVCSVELCEWLVRECGSGSRNKFIPGWLKNQNTDVLRIVFDTMIKGDGWINGQGFGYRSISKKLLDDIGEISVKLGYAVTYNNDVINISKVQIYPTINTEPEVYNYVGKIYCVSVPNERIFVRRNGKTIWSGNSYKPQKIVESLSGGTKPDILAIGHFHKAEYLFYRNVHILQAGTMQNQTPFMQTKGLSAHVSGWMLDLFAKKDGTLDRVDMKFFPYYE
jgi:predicted phosphodiesterase